MTQGFSFPTFGLLCGGIVPSTQQPDLDDLNALYVYEAKMSLLVRMCQSRCGAERLLESRLLPVLADCDFLDTRPEADQAFIGTYKRN